MRKPNSHMKTAWILFALAAGSAALAMVEADALEARAETASTLNAGYVGCVSTYHLEQFDIATDRAQIGVLLNEWCMPTDDLQSYRFVVLNYSGKAGIERVRVFVPDEEPTDLYLPVAAVTKEPM